MKIVQSFWTKPSCTKGNLKFQNRFAGGWLDNKYNFMSWALSCLQFRKFYDEVELITDRKGKELLIDKLQLPYSNVIVELDQLNDYYHDLWVLPKIYAYSIQKEPFIHADGDVYIWKKFDERIENAQLLAQSLGIDFEPQRVILKEIDDHFNYLPEIIQNDRNTNNSLHFSNAGIIGGNDFLFFHNFSKLVFEFVNRNIDNVSQITTGLLGMIYEEYYFYCMAKHKGIDIEYLLGEFYKEFDGLIDFSKVPGRTTYIHPVGTYKKHMQICENLAFRLKLDHPDYYYRIEHLCKKFKI
jgi:hypothetical protein